ncbi:PrsW family intramembrane metalloprotease [bacterium]|nr:PrsW family intramembrane metalloprotease [bacterium]
MTLTSIIAFAIATFIPLAILWFIRSRNMYQTGSFIMVLGAFFWGVLVYAMAALINSRLLLGTGLINVETLVRYIAPWEEEILKALLFIYLFRKINFTYFVDGAITGFAIGIGFAIVENYEYVTSFQSAALGVAISRVISTNLIHAAATATTGIAFGLARFHKGGRMVGTILGGLSLAIILHLGFNNLVNRVSSSFLLLYAASVGILATIVIYLMIRRGLKQAKNWIQEKLGTADRVTASEAQAVQKVTEDKHLLASLTEMFGAAQAAQIHKFLLIQARLGIHRKNLERFQDPALVSETQKEITTLQGEMNILRREVGPYTMSMLRSLFPLSENMFWSQLENTLADRMKNPSRPSSGMWEKLQSATQQNSDNP